MKKRFLAVLMLAVCLIIMVSGCGVGTKESAAMDTVASTETAMPSAGENSFDSSSEMDAGEIAEEGITSQSGIEPVSQSGRKLIKTVRLEMQTKEFDSVVDGIGKKVQEMEGYVESSSVWGSSYYNTNNTRNSNYTVRIPSNRLDEFIQVVSGLGNVTYKNESIEDVTLQYVDVESRQKALETEQKRLLELLEQADNLEDLLTIESRLSEVRYELENYGSQKRLLDNQIDYSTVYITITEVERITETGERTFLQEIGDRFNESLYMVGTGVRGFIIGLIGSLPLLVVWGAVIAMIVWIIRKVFYGKKREKKEKKEYKIKVEDEPKE